jgi:hypothetical protein
VRHPVWWRARRYRRRSYGIFVRACGVPWLRDPWRARAWLRAAVMADYDDYIRKKLRDYCHWHRWRP